MKETFTFIAFGPFPPLPARPGPGGPARGSPGQRRPGRGFGGGGRGAGTAQPRQLRAVQGHRRIAAEGPGGLMKAGRNAEAAELAQLATLACPVEIEAYQAAHEGVAGVRKTGEESILNS